MRCFLFIAGLCCCLPLLPLPVQAAMYSYVDAKGVYHYTNVPGDGRYKLKESPEPNRSQRLDAEDRLMRTIASKSQSQVTKQMYDLFFFAPGAAPIYDYSYEDFCEWIWISCNYVPFMSLVQKNGCEYADGGFGSMVPIEEAIKRGATEIDAIILQTEVTYFNRLPSKNVFSLITNLFGFMLDRIENQNIRIGKFAAVNKDVIINFYYTPTVLTTNSLIFDKVKMERWWESGFSFAKYKNEELNQIEP